MGINDLGQIVGFFAFPTVIADFSRAHARLVPRWSRNTATGGHFSVARFCAVAKAASKRCRSRESLYAVKTVVDSRVKDSLGRSQRAETVDRSIRYGTAPSGCEFLSWPRLQPPAPRGRLSRSCLRAERFFFVMVPTAGREPTPMQTRKRVAGPRPSDTITCPRAYCRKPLRTDRPAAT